MTVVAPSEVDASQRISTRSMRTVTLRISDEEHRNLQAMAEWKRVSLSDLIRDYCREGLYSDLADTSFRDEIEQSIQREKQRLEELGRILENARSAGAED